MQSHVKVIYIKVKRYFDYSDFYKSSELPRLIDKMEYWSRFTVEPNIYKSEAQAFLDSLSSLRAVPTNKGYA